MSTHPLLFLPGLLCDEHLWHHQLRYFGSRYACQVASLTQDDNVAAMARRALQSAPERFALIALSMGGYVAFEMLRQAPERISHLVLLSTSAGSDSPRRRQDRLAGISMLQQGRFAGVTSRLLPQLVHPSRVAESVATDVQLMAQRVGGEAYLRQQQAILDRPDSMQTLASIQVPTLIAVGDHDVLTPPAESHAMQRAIPQAALHIFERCGHLPPLEMPDQVNQLLEQWLLAGLPAGQ